MAPSNNASAGNGSATRDARSVFVNKQQLNGSAINLDHHKRASEERASFQASQVLSRIFTSESEDSRDGTSGSKSNGESSRTFNSGSSLMSIRRESPKDTGEQGSDFSGFSDDGGETLFIPVSGSESQHEQESYADPKRGYAPETQISTETRGSSQGFSQSSSVESQSAESQNVEGQGLIEVKDSDNERRGSDSLRFKNLATQAIDLEPESLEKITSVDSESEEIEIVQVVDVPKEKRFLRKRAKMDPENPKEKRLKIIPSDDSFSQSSPVNKEFSHSGSDHQSSNSDSSVSSYSDSDSFVVDSRYSRSRGSEKQTISSTHIDVNESEDSDVSHFATGNDSEVVVIDSEEESEGYEVHVDRTGPRSAVHLLKNLSGRVSNEQTAGLNSDTVSMHDLVGASDLMETYQFNFSVDVEYFLTFLHESFSAKKRKVCFITGQSVLKGHPLRKRFEEKFNISEAIAPLPHRYASHHSKMMINVFENNEVEIVIMTSNLTLLDFGGLSQSVWRSGRLKRGSTDTELGSRFQSDLLQYLACYEIPITKLLILQISRFDFSPVKVELVASAPGSYNMRDISPTSEAYGFVKLRQVLDRNNLLITDSQAKHNIASQVTSIASPYVCQKGQTSSVFTHLLCPLMFSDWKTLAPGGESFSEHQDKFNYKPHYVFPRIKDIAESSFGYSSGSAVHFNYTGSLAQTNQYEQNVKKYLYKWKTRGNVTGREHLTPHCKYYACDNGDDWKSLKWVLVGSHNLSKQAWGYPVAKSKGEKYDVSSYELSVLIPGGPFLVPTYKSDYLDPKDKSNDDHNDDDKNKNKKKDILPIRMPFVLPPVKYGPTDLPWSTVADCGDRKDRYGKVYRGM